MTLKLLERIRSQDMHGFPPDSSIRVLMERYRLQLPEGKGLLDEFDLLRYYWAVEGEFVSGI
jgi:hypothetical protein